MNQPPDAFLVVNGWTIFAHPLFLDQIEVLLKQVDQGEHQRVLGEFKQFKTRIDKGMIAFGRSFVRERLPQWFGLHVTTMDSALAAHIKIQSETY